jgi:hypothetical protein
VHTKMLPYCVEVVQSGMGLWTMVAWAYGHLIIVLDSMLEMTIGYKNNLLVEENQVASQLKRCEQGRWWETIAALQL